MARGSASAGSIIELFAAFSANKAARREAKSLKKQGNLAAEEAIAESEREQREGERFQARQALGFLKSGVSLQGTPLTVLAETEAETTRQTAATRRAGFSRRSLLREKAEVVRGGGRAQVIGAVAAGASSSFAASTEG